MLSSINVTHNTGSYPIFFVAALDDAYNELSDILQPADDFVLVVNATVAKLYRRQLERLVRRLGCKHPIIVIADGEEEKNLSSIEFLCAQFSVLGLSRQSIILAIGGGVTTDLVGFAAASYMRGVGYVQIPTTLLAQVDASIGGKTGVNLRAGKNLVGAFHQPRAVMINSEFLAGLPVVEISCGFAEIIKHALLADAGFFAELEQHPSLVNLARAAAGDAEKQQSQAAMQQIIRRACQIKVDIVQQDEREQGRRALLNLGHTFGHALEALGGYRQLKHGEAVALGIVIAGRISRELGDLAEADYQRILAVLAAAGLPTQPNKHIGSAKKLDRMLGFIMRDKKQHHQGVPLILLKRIGEAYISAPYSKEQLKQALQQVL